MKKKVIIIGGGFAGIQLVRNLDKSLFDILLIDKINHHQFQPLFYQVATSQIEPSIISFQLRHIFNKTQSTQIRLAEVKQILPDKNQIQTDIGIFDFDYLIIASGCKTNYFNNTNIKANSFPLKSTFDAINIRNHILTIFEKTLSETNENKKALLNLIIVGAGPTGVELAGAFAEIKKHVLPKDYPGIDFSNFTIYLIEGSKNTLNNMSEKSQTASMNYLMKMGVQVITGVFVKDYDGKIATLSNGQNIESVTMIWAAGVTGNKIDGLPKECWTPTNRIIVNRMNQIENFPNLYAVGDIAWMQTPQYPNGHPQVANVAINQAKKLAKNLKHQIQNKTTSEFEYKDFGTMATIGRNKAVVEFLHFKFKGYLAWLVWMFLHLMLILSVRNKLIIFINWAWTYTS
ncbi:MAG: NAD(P)/FAD-dependent oxidoreductase, partial [Chitinophagaceae bacterium]|nr:NAD(P)/FAD-dependent oxidoreductase [Chitinophagaceae bacterium]